MREKLYLEQLVNHVSGINPEDFIGKDFKQSLHAIYHGSTLNLFKIESQNLLGKDEYYGPVHLCVFIDKFLKGSARVHRIAEKFGKHLDKTQLKLPTSILPYKEGSSYLIEFPKTFEDSATGDCHKSALVYMGVQAELKSPVNNDRIILGLENCKKGLIFVFPDYDKQGKLSHTQTYIRLDPSTGDTIDAIIERNFKETENSKNHIKDIVAFTLKCLLYIESGDPDLQDEKAKPLLTKNPKKIRRHLKNNCPFDLVNVGYDFHYRHYTAGETEVTGHFRWQPYGPGRAQVKLIWIDEHKRTYKEK